MDDRGILLCRGIPGMPGLTVPSGKYPYPDTVTDIAKLIRERGFEAFYEDPREDRAIIAHKAADIWVPVMQVTSSLLLSVSSGLFTALILDLLGIAKGQNSVLHVETRVLDEDGSVREFKADGTGGDVLRALDAFEGEFRNESGLGDPQTRPKIDGEGD